MQPKGFAFNFLNLNLGKICKVKLPYTFVVYIYECKLLRVVFGYFTLFI